MSTSERLQDRALGRWPAILSRIGIDHDRYLTGKHGPCPLCGGKDRWRFDNKGGKGSFFCTTCGSGHGIQLVMKYAKVQFAEAKRMIEQHLPDAPVAMPSATSQASADKHVWRWGSGQVLDGTDLASRYLFSRGIEYSTSWNTPLRVMHRVLYRHDDDTREEIPAMAAIIAGLDGTKTVHYTFLDPETAAKAQRIDRPGFKQRKLAPGRFPEAGAVRLFRPAATMGVAEGIETALSAAQLYGVPVWATTSAGALARWKPPPEAKHIIVFGDADRGFAGQHAAYALAQALSVAGLVVDVELPPLGTDWNDVLVKRQKRGVSQ